MNGRVNSCGVFGPLVDIYHVFASGKMSALSEALEPCRRAVNQPKQPVCYAIGRVARRLFGSANDAARFDLKLLIHGGQAQQLLGFDKFL